MNTFDTARVDAALRSTIFHGKLHHFPVIDSTNTRALTDAQAGAESGQVYIADEQTAGRGRGGHTWHSEPDRGLYLTVLVRPEIKGNEALKLSLATGIAASDAIHRVTGNSIDLRWPNDLVIPGDGGPSKKCGGILTESSLAPDGSLRHAAIGIGINLNQSDFPADLASTATSLRRAWGHIISREDLAIELLRALHAELQQRDATLYDRFEQRSTWVRGKRVHVAEAEGYTGTTAGLTADGLLLVQCDDQQTRAVRHGGVREL
ncbi:birA, biotin-(acetyl-CoA-carboxylase) ligase [Terriglobus roseus DSM 18391]|uniref:BirA, biotin-(Acetyl-CoA-carboxylase) ligase n=1 Tax=Terriglobus roseus (strain DSM 18391 / NRRL B-41598 / KBS 63) TaxID=926566 RepID=I3ZDL8_TERRK|nr:biotin--[acetyl-CoA-carboxylase] ligase [Terriglobus roseus]AFL87336.1 birA, biotin-(acetyl-CoA-carboxylase) ligase [Terriglobus roseus DSM 18391]